jgi:hypothetical protein
MFDSWGKLSVADLGDLHKVRAATPKTSATSPSNDTAQETTGAGGQATTALKRYLVFHAEEDGLLRAVS